MQKHGSHDLIEEFNCLSISICMHEVVIEQETQNGMSKFTSQMGEHGACRGFPKMFLIKILDVIS